MDKPKIESWGDDESKCLLTPTYPKSFTSNQSEAHLPNESASLISQLLFNSSLVCSDPNLTKSGAAGDEDSQSAAYTNLIDCPALSETAIQQFNDDGLESSILDPEHECTSACVGLEPGHAEQVARLISSRAHTPKSSCFFYSGSQPSIITNPGSAVGYMGGHKQSFSTREIREQHLQIQKKYRHTRRRRYTDPIDFDGILNIIGGCSWWQIWVYLLISLQQIPHAMFNLSVVYMMYQPDHWCIVPGFNTTDPEFKWGMNDAVFNYSIIYPKTMNKQRDAANFHSQCHYFDRGVVRYNELRKMTLAEAQDAISGEPAPEIVRCQQWAYKQDVMKETIVTEWNLVCDDNFKRAHAHLFYSLGFLIGCSLGGFGRKPTIIGFGVLSSMFGLILPYSTYFPMFLFIRFCGAICNEAADLASMIGSLLQAPWAVGYALLALIAYTCKSWQIVQLITAALHTISICLICVLPESPRWLIVNDRVDEAERYIRKACRDPPFPFTLCTVEKSSLPCDLELTRHTEQNKWVKENQRANMMHILKSRVLCLRTIVICVVWIATALVYYGVIIALSDQSAPGRVLSGNFFVNNAVAGAIELPTLIFCVFLMKYGRKRSQMVTLIAAAVFILSAMAAINSKNQMLSLGLMLLGKISIQAAFNILYIFTSEMYPTVIRNSAVGFCSMIARFGSGVSSYIAILSDVTLAMVPMIIFAGFSLVAGILVLLLPETRDHDLPETLKDAVNDGKYEYYGFEGRKVGASWVDKDSEASTAGVNCRDGQSGSYVAEPEEERENVPTTISSRRSETFTGTDLQLPAIPEVSDFHESIHLSPSERSNSTSRSVTPTDFEDLKISRRRHTTETLKESPKNELVSTSKID